MYIYIYIYISLSLSPLKFRACYFAQRFKFSSLHARSYHMQQISTEVIYGDHNGKPSKVCWLFQSQGTQASELID